MRIASIAEGITARTRPIKHTHKDMVNYLAKATLAYEFVLWEEWVEADPDELVETYGPDSLRSFKYYMTAQLRDSKYDVISLWLVDVPHNPPLLKEVRNVLLREIR